MAENAKRDREMSEREIREVFETLKLPTAPKPFVPTVPKPSQYIVFFTVSGHSPPLKMP